MPKDSTAKTLADLKGKKIGLSLNSESHLDLIVSLKELGLDDKTDFELVNLQPNELPAALEKGLVDAVLIRQPQTLRLEESLGAKSIKTWPFRFTSIVRTEYLTANPKAVKNYVEALKDAVLFIATNSDQAATWFAESQRLDPSVVKKLTGENPTLCRQEARGHQDRSGRRLQEAHRRAPRSGDEIRLDQGQARLRPF